MTELEWEMTSYTLAGVYYEVFEEHGLYVAAERSTEDSLEGVRIGEFSTVKEAKESCEEYYREGEGL